MKPTISATEAVKLLRERGVRITVARLISGIQQGYYPWGRVVGYGETGRRTVEIFTKEFAAWMEEVT